MQDNGVRVGTGYMFAGVTEGSNGRAKKRKPDLNTNKVDDSAVRFPLPVGKQVVSMVRAALIICTTV
jgi:hypothetical protein